MKRDAVISECGRYRYRLYRGWAPERQRTVLWVMLNPSTADAHLDDPTIRRCIAFSTSLGYGDMWVANWYAYRATDPAELWKLPSMIDAIGPENDRHLAALAKRCDRIIVAWGADGPAVPCESLRTPDGLWRLGTTKSGKPRHPLYVRSGTPLIPWRPDSRIGGP